MDPVQTEIYSTVLTAAPYVIAAYVLLWVVLLVFIVVAFRNLTKTEKQLAALEEAVELLERKQG
ncbi:MAG: hypothetical protein LBP91_04990, partial [Coriobacteriales bacterium]|nr:hypothetical protein [Coriobacteriales bacterium]